MTKILGKRVLWVEIGWRGEAGTGPENALLHSDMRKTQFNGGWPLADLPDFWFNTQIRSLLIWLVSCFSLNIAAERNFGKRLFEVRCVVIVLLNMWHFQPIAQ